MKYFVYSSLLFLIWIPHVYQAQDPLFPNSVVSNDIDFILGTDPDAFLSLTFLGLEDKEMPDSQTDILFDQDTFVFEATFSDGEPMEIWCHSSFLTQEAAEEYAEKLCPRLGKLPGFQRDLITHVVIHNGDAGAFAEIEGNFFVLYSDNMDDRISTNDLEETVFHESVHASYQEIFEDDPTWLSAQAADPAFVTDYAQSFPDLEDMPETALFAYAYITYPGRLSAEIEEWLETNIPNRLAFFGGIYPAGTASIGTELNPLKVQCFPNPTNGSAMLSLPIVSEGTQIRVLSIEGGEVLATKARVGLNEIALGEFAPGIYIVVVPGYQPSRIVRH